MMVLLQTGVVVTKVSPLAGGGGLDLREDDVITAIDGKVSTQPPQNTPVSPAFHPSV